MKKRTRYPLKEILAGNLKLECVILLSSIILFILDQRLNWLDYKEIQCYFSEERINAIITFISIVVGIYIAIISIFSTSTTSTSEKIIEKNLDGSLVASTCAGLIESLLLILLTVFLLDFWNGFYYWIATLTLLSCISFCKFIIFIIITYQYNLSTLAKQIDAEANFKKDVLNQLEKIEQNTLHKK